MVGVVGALVEGWAEAGRARTYGWYGSAWISRKGPRIGQKKSDPHVMV